MISKDFDNYIFDLYGTLFDVWTDEHAAQTWKKWGRWLDDKKIKHPHYIQFRRDFFEADQALRDKKLSEGEFDYPEIDVVEIYRELFERYQNGILPDEILIEASYAFRVASRKRIKLFPGVEEYLRKIRESGKHAYILSNAQATYTEPEILMFGLDKMVDDYLMSSDFGCMKPDKKFFFALMDKYKMNPERTVMHGDSGFSDVGGAKNAGISWIHLVDENDPNTFYLHP